jgi:MFS family permease
VKGKLLPRVYLYLFTQFLERLAYTNVLIQLPIYIAQKGMQNTLGWSQETKGWIFFIWALIQNLTPVFMGSLADKISHQKAILLSLIIVSLGYIGLAYSYSFELFTFSVVLIGFGSGFFKPSLQGKLSELGHSRVWAYYLFASNVAFLLGILFSKLLKEFSWNVVFFGSFFIAFLNIVLNLFYLTKTRREVKHSNNNNEKFLSLTEILFAIKEKKMFVIICITTFFAIIYMQFYETLPNFIVDWVNTSNIVASLNLPNFLTMETSLGRQISYEILYLINPILILLFVTNLQSITAKEEITTTLLIAMFLTTIGFMLCGFSRNGTYLLIGFVVYTFGEMLFNMKILELINKIAPTSRKATYFGILNISYTLGLTSGALSGGYIYKYLAEKYTLAKNYLSNYSLHSETQNPIAKLSEILHTSDVTSFLWNTYHPYLFWIPYVIIGIFGILLILRLKKYKLN